MMNEVICRRSMQYVILVLSGSLLFCTACATGPSQEEAAVAEVRDAERKALAEENVKLKNSLADRNALCQQLEETLKEQGAARKGLENQMAKLTLQLVEKDTQIEKIEDRQGALQKKLDEAIQEVVRTKAKLRSLESKAEAASNMAETEIALKVLITQRPEQERDPELVQAEQLLKMSAKEFKKENYGGALYLANQAKSHIRNAQMRLGDREELALMPGEVLFALPLPLQVIKMSNVREGPGLDFKVIATVEPNTPLIGYSYKGQWVRVKGENELKGWIFQSLVSGR
ncbi:MAG: SH3 domain-containing protein [Desulfobacteraceae bacterium]